MFCPWARRSLNALKAEADLRGAADLFYDPEVSKGFAANGCSPNGSVRVDHGPHEVDVLTPAVMTDRDPRRKPEALRHHLGNLKPLRHRQGFVRG